MVRHGGLRLLLKACPLINEGDGDMGGGGLCPPAPVWCFPGGSQDLEIGIPVPQAKYEGFGLCGLIVGALRLIRGRE